MSRQTGRKVAGALIGHAYLSTTKTAVTWRVWSRRPSEARPLAYCVSGRSCSRACSGRYSRAGLCDMGAFAGPCEGEGGA